MLSSLQIEHFRGFETLKLPDLERVNLLVGANNTGKTTVLEAVEFLGGGGHIGPLLRIAMRRGEYFQRDDGRDGIDIRHLFHNRKHEVGAYARVEGGEGDGQFAEMKLAHSDGQMDLYEEPGATDYETFVEKFSLQLSGDKIGEERDSRPGTINLSRLDSRRGPRLSRHLRSKHTQFAPISPDSWHNLSELWDQIVLTPREEHVYQALRLIEPDIERLAFLGKGSHHRSPFAGAVVKRSGSESRVPVGSLGDGIKRLLSLSLHLASASGGFLLVDEIDTGLHYTVLKDMWRLVLRTAEELDVQVFATTHSLDCLRSLANFLEEESSELSSTVSVQRVEPEMDKSICYSQDELTTAIEQELEIR